MKSKKIEDREAYLRDLMDGESEFTFGQGELICETFFPEYRAGYVMAREIAA